MSEVIQYEGTNWYTLEETPFSLTPGQATSGFVGYQIKSGQLLYGYATEKLTGDLFNFTPG